MLSRKPTRTQSAITMIVVLAILAFVLAYVILKSGPDPMDLPVAQPTEEAEQP